MEPKEPKPRAPGDSTPRKPPFAPVAAPSVGLPKSGGALQALGEKFQAGGPTGTASYHVPLPISPCRGVAPKLALAYDSGHGNGPFGIGWALSIPDVTRRTDKGLPRYADATESDVFVLSDQEDLVPVVGSRGRDGDYRVDAYRPRVEGLFARVERRTHVVTGDAHWRAISSDNVTSIFGWSSGARVANPKDPRQVYRWLLEAVLDSHGNATRYEYKAEDLVGVDASDPAEATRLVHLPANAYPKYVWYGNTTPLIDRDPSYAAFAALAWLFQVVLDYGEHTTDLPAQVSPWHVRPDPFSSFRPTFELRTYRLCQRVLMFHLMPDQLGADARLVRAAELTYDASPLVTYLTSVRGAGYAWDAGPTTVAYTPTLRFDYTRVGALSTTVATVDAASRAQAPAGLDGKRYELVDLDGDGIAGILAAAATPAPALYYKRNLGGGAFAPAERLPAQPAQPALGTDVRLLSLDADGRLDVVALGGSTPGFYERTRDAAWRPFAPFASLPRIDWGARGVHLLDVDGDGLADVLVAQDDVFVWYPSLARDGFGPPNRVTQAHDEDRGAVVLTTDDHESIFLADMTGDGLADLVRIRNGDVAYWPNLGYGRFGAKIAMSGAPQFDAPDLFDPRRVRLGDVDGTGTTDLVYLSARGAVVYLNQSGNRWAPGVAIPLPPADGLASVQLADLLGTGTSCLVWSSPEPAQAGAPLRYVDLLRSTKPHLLCSIANGMGGATAITYAPSTRYYLEDRAAGRPWATRLPFPVQVVDRVETTDAVASTRTVLRYRYAHGFYDGVERELRGFARVDAWDAEAVSDGAFALPPVHTISWFHTGAWDGEGDDLRTALGAEYYAGDPLAAALPADAMPADLLPPALREAYRSLKGRLLRQEVYADDASADAGVPYSATDVRYEVRELQPIGAQRHGVYHPFERERVVASYERDPTDPRVAHELALEVDPLGHVVRAARVAYARRTAAEPEQGAVLATCTATAYALPIDAAGDYRHGVVTETARYELRMPPTSVVQPFSAIDDAMTGSAPVPFDAPLAAGARRTLEREQHTFWADDLSAPLALGSSGARALPHDRLALALPATLLTTALGGRVTAADLLAAGYVAPDGDLWIHAGATAYDPAAFYQPTAYTDPFGNTARVAYDPLKLLAVEAHTSALAAFDNVTTAVLDYRVLAPKLVTDPNGNRSAAAFHELGMITAIALEGTGEGDTLADPTVVLAYDLLAWETATPSPACVHTSARRVHGPTSPGWLETFAYSDASGHEILRKVQAAPDGAAARWTCSGRTAFDNKGNPVKQYDPYFSATSDYEPESALSATAYCALHTYDPLSRLIRTDLADGTFSTVAFGAWEHVEADANDNVLASAWYADASARPATDPLNRAATLAAAHANTPTRRAVDALGRMFLVSEDNGPLGLVRTRTGLDVQDNAVTVTDELGSPSAARTFDALGRALVSTGADTGTSLAIADGAGGALRTWDARNYAHRTVYDALHRATQVWTTPPAAAELLAELTVYGEGVAAPNFRGHVYLAFDGSGVAATTAYDFEGHATRTSRQLALDYTATPSWASLAAIADPNAVLPAAAVLLDHEVLASERDYDALDHVVRAVTPDGSVTVTTYDLSARLGAVSTFVRGAATVSPIVTGVEYNACGQRTRVAGGTGLVSTYTYDARNRLTMRIRSTRASDGAPLQDLAYTYDPVHNAVQVDDAAQAAVYFAGTVTTGSQQFAYDALYRLASATGREQPGQIGYALGPDGYAEAPLSTLPHPNDLQALVPYRENYAYDAVGNLRSMTHVAGGTGWTRTQTIAPGSNHIAAVSQPGDPTGGPYTGAFVHDPAGNLTRMPNLSALTWDHAGRLAGAALGSGGTVYFTYDAKGVRVRKVVERGGKRFEHICVGTYERYRESLLVGGAATLARETLHVGDGARRFALIETKTVDESVRGLVPTTLARFQLPNLVASACVEADAGGAVLSYEEYYPYGGSSFRAGDADKRYRYAGKERDEETGLYYVGARYYAPWLGRWISADPAGFVDGTNVYRYARDNPVTLTDPTGMDTTPDAAQVAAATQAAALILARIGAAGVAGAGTGSVVAGGGAAAAGGGAVLVTATPFAGSIFVVASFVTAGAIAGTGYISTLRQSNIGQFGNPWGVRRPGFGILDHVQPQGMSQPKPLPDLKPPPGTDPNVPRLGRTYVTYTKYNRVTGLTYSGRTSMVVDLSKPIEPQVDAAVKLRDANHHINTDENAEPQDRGFDPAQVDKHAEGLAVNYANRYSDPAYIAIRGREQQLIDAHGGAQSDTGKPYKTENTIRGFGADNPLGRLFHAASNLVFQQQLAPYTGK